MTDSNLAFLSLADAESSSDLDTRQIRSRPTGFIVDLSPGYVLTKHIPLQETRQPYFPDRIYEWYTAVCEGTSPWDSENIPQIYKMAR